MEKVIVAMSGGVDSSVAAAILKEKGYEVEGVFMKNWSPQTIQSLTDCPWEQDQKDAAAVCAVLGIPFRSINFEREYKERVVDYFLTEYQAGRTPNPDVMCNKEIKFGAFLEAARRLDADYIATGHYALSTVDAYTEKALLWRGADKRKDQSYFLHALTGDQLRRTIFSIGGMTKPEVRQAAERYRFPTARKKDSQGICFIGHLDLKKFLREQITGQRGDTYLLPAVQVGETIEERQERAKPVGTHDGTMFFTIGERAGVVVDNSLYRRLQNRDVSPTYILKKNYRTNVLYVTDDADDPDLFSNYLEIEQYSPTGDSIFPLDPSGLTVQIRYQQQDEARVKAVHSLPDSGMGVYLRTPVKAAAEGQSLVFYAGDQVMGGGVIRKAERV
ncbi:tRNA 2-thiouridine(34) synthase MnmA [Patescibacteria group bacterium]|nr:tRNA 2-thiouridine(34) synthase MnmA [Patescibacteria group bacterium]